jgi:pimeloyl-ACP methyl ester carboxylesterase/surface antigen
LNGECVTVIARYLQEEYGQKGFTMYLGNGKDTAEQVARQFSQFFKPISDPSDPVRGSIISFPEIGGGYGHVAIVAESRRVNGQLQVRITDSNSSQFGRVVKEHSSWITISGSNYSAAGYGSRIYWTNPVGSNSSIYTPPAPAPTPPAPIPPIQLVLPRTGGSLASEGYIAKGNETKLVRIRGLDNSEGISKSRLVNLPPDSIQNKKTWIVIHGMNNSGDDLLDLARAVEGQSDFDQVFVLDWNNYAQGVNARESTAWITEVAYFAAQRLNVWGITNNNINIVGHSFGTYVGYEISKKLFEFSKPSAPEESKKIGKIIALDPGITTFGGYTENSVDFSLYSNYSWAFQGSLLGNEKIAQSARESFKMSFSFTYLNDPTSHGAVKDAFSDILRRNNNKLSCPYLTSLFNTDNMDSSLEEFKLWKNEANSFEASLKIEDIKGRWEVVDVIPVKPK